MWFFSKKIEVVENIENSSTLGKIQKLLEFSEEVHEIAKCTKEVCPIGMYNEKLRKVVLNPSLDYDYNRNFFLKTLVEYPVFQSISNYRIKVKKV